MKNANILVAFAASFAAAAVPHAILSGKPAVAQDVNENFVALDSAIQNRATKSDLGAKIDSASVAKLLKGKADTASTTWIKAKADSAWVLDKLKGKLDASADAKYLKAADSVVNARSFFITPDVTSLASGAPWYGIGRASIPELAVIDASSKGLQVQVAGFYGLRLKTSQHVIDIPSQSGDGPVTIDGKMPLYNGGNLGKGIFDNTNPPVGSWAFECNCGADNSITSPSGAGNIQVFSTGNANRGFQIAAPYDADAYFLRRGKGAWQTWVQVVHSGNIAQFALAPTGGTITGDLRISGKLVTDPGATPADYVFEPDYKLASLSDIEAYTKENKHLPEVPSAAEMTSKGVDLAAMNMALLKKVEELTLHAIAQQKEIDSQKLRIDALEAKTSGL